MVVKIRKNRSFRFYGIWSKHDWIVVGREALTDVYFSFTNRVFRPRTQSFSRPRRFLDGHPESTESPCLDITDVHIKFIFHENMRFFYI